MYENAGRLLSARVTSRSSEFRAEAPHVILSGGFMHDDTDPNMRYVDMARDGRLLIVEASQAPEDTSLVLAQHWDVGLQN